MFIVHAKNLNLKTPSSNNPCQGAPILLHGVPSEESFA